MTTQPFFLAAFRDGPALGDQQAAVRHRKINEVTDFVGFQVHAVNPIGELSRQAYSH
jgi:hypothetical protein